MENRIKKAEMATPIVQATGPHCQPSCEESRLSVAPSPSFLSACLSLSQTRDALLKILEDIKEEDYLNFILFDSDVTTWKDTLVQATPENIQEAREFVKNIRDRGSKNRGESNVLTALPLPEQPVSLPSGAQALLARPADPGWGRGGSWVGSSGLISGSKKTHLSVSKP